MIYGILGLELIDGPVVPVVGLVALALLVLVVLPRPRHPLRLAVGAVAGAAVGAGAAIVFDATRTFGIGIPQQAGVWAGVGLALAGAGVAALWGGGRRRTVPAALLVVVSVLLGALGVNRAIDVTHNLAAIIGVQAVPPIALPALTTAGAASDLSSWTPPADMPAHGEVGALSDDARIPSPGFEARDASIYLPPAALVKDPPKLPLLVFMMGQPGSPEPTQIARTLDAYAAQHRGLAPIAIVADQLTGPTVDPACHDSERFGAVSSYFNVEIPAFAKARLNVIDAVSARAIGGYSNGGSCAVLWAAQHPDVWGGLLDVSGNEFPGSETVAATTAAVFGGDSAAFEAAKPAAVMAAQAAAHPGLFDGHTAVFTLGSDDDLYGPGQNRNADAARAAGFTVQVVTIPGAGHVGAALDQGLVQGFAVLAPAMGL
ncbi:alpha/beta hydrolase [Microbacterium sp. CJ88]|uniref:alpha/beta hydrolase n=1 Tax=Microbacterium sp. CJ88 TaxID=3445672 RepID=UPI003F6551C8